MLKFVRTAALLCALAVLPATLLAQTPPGAVELDLGIKAGVNLATLNGEGESPGRRTGFIGGGHLTISLPNSMFYFQPELLYSMKGFSESQEGITGTLALDYIDVPVLVGIHFATGGSITPRIFAGPQVSIKAGCTLKGDGEFFDAESVLFDLIFGGGLDFDMGKVDIVFDARYDLGLTDALALGSSKMSAWQFLAGVAFPLGN